MRNFRSQKDTSIYEHFDVMGHVQDPDGEGGPTLKEVQRPVVAAPSPIRPKPPASYAVRDPLQVSAGDVLDCSVRLKVRSKIVTAVRRCVVLRVVPPRLSRTALKALATLRKSPDACSLSKISALLLGLSAGQNPDTTEKPDTWKVCELLRKIPVLPLLADGILSIQCVVRCATRVKKHANVLLQGVWTNFNFLLKS